MYANGNSEIEYDFVANVRTEQGGVRIWVYRMICDSRRSADTVEKPQQVGAKANQMEERRNYLMSHLNKQFAENNDGPSDSVVPNPLQFRPQHETLQTRT